MIGQKWYAPYISQWGDEEPSMFPETLAQTIPIQPGKTNLLDIGCGSGIIGIFCLVKKSARFVTFTDLEPKWIDVSRHNVGIKIKERAIQPTQVNFLKPGSFDAISLEEARRHDLLAFNPPQLPFAYVDEKTKQKIDGDPIEKRFRFGGADGLDLARRFFKWYGGLAMPKPDAVIILSSFLGRNEINQAIAEAGLTSHQPIETDAPLRKLLWEKAESFSRSETQAINRSITKIDGIWHKRLLTYRLTGS